MDILNLAEEVGLFPKKASSTNGGEFKSACPNCQDGKDRFCIWPNKGKAGCYWCRVCEAKGDAIQFCRDFLGMTFHQACQKVNITPQMRAEPQNIKRHTFKPHQPSLISSSWQQVANRYIDYCHENLMREPSVINQLAQRGLTLETIKQFCLGWNTENLFDRRERLGLPSETKENGFDRRQWLPKGFVIPSFEGANPTKIKIRRSDWFSEDTFPKYVEISGSKQSPSVYGNPSKPVIIVESELDAILIQQKASDLVCSVALGGVSKKPDTELHALLKKAPLILLSLDFDEVGKKHYSFWIKQYPNLRSWPIPFDKSPGDAIEKSHINVINLKLAED
ncbi:MAG: DNA primase [Chlamydiae bacterium]|nr:DNA primase [Chlamydiota bacterium]